MESKPRIRPGLTTADKISEIAGWTLLATLWAMVIINYSQLPETIPTHYNAIGQADGFGGRFTILLLPIVASVLFAGLTILNRFPYIFNYPVTVTEENALKHYANTTRMIRYIKLGAVIVFGVIALKTIRIANGRPDWFGVWFLPLLIGLIVIPNIYFIVKTFRIK